MGAGAVGGVTAAGLTRAGHAVATLTTNPKIAAALRRFVDQIKDRSALLPDSAFVKKSSRLHRTEQLAGLLNELPVRSG